MAERYYSVEYLTSEGNPAHRLFFLSSRQDVRREVERLNGVVQSIKEHHQSWLNREYYSRDYKINFLRSLAFHIDVGVSAGQALVYFIESERNSSKRAEMQRALAILDEGGQFADAVITLPFIEKSIAMLLQTGDATGTINDAIRDAIAIAESHSASWKTIGAAFGWISLDLFSAVSSVYALQFYALPWFRKNPPAIQDAEKLLQYNDELDLISNFSMLLSVATSAAVAATFAFLICFFFGSAAVKTFLDNRVIRIPALRGIFIDGAMSDGFLLLSRMVKNGVPLLHAIELLAAHSWINATSQFWRSVTRALYAGQEVNRAFSASGLLSEAEISALSTHQHKTHLANILASMSVRRREQAGSNTRRFVQLSIALTLVYMLLVVALVLWLLSLQNMGLSGSFEELMMGGF